MNNHYIIMKGSVKFIKKFDKEIRISNKDMIVIGNSYYLNGLVTVQFLFEEECKHFKVDSFYIVELILPYPPSLVEKPIKDSIFFIYGNGYEVIGKFKYDNHILAFDD